MPKFLIVLRKKLALPLKWAVYRNLRAKRMVWKKKKQLVERNEELLQKLAYAKRKRDLAMENYTQGQVDLLEELINYTQKYVS